jgi:protease-4
MSNFKKFIKWLVILLVFISALIAIKDEVAYRFNLGFWSDKDSALNETVDESIGENTWEAEEICNTFGIELHGYVVTYIAPESKDEDGNMLSDETASENVVFAIEDADRDDTIKAIILEIDSYGGYPVAAEEIANALKRAKKPTVALVRSAALSAAYWSASGADIIFASALSDIGSIGVTMSYLDSYKKNLTDGLNYNSLSVGKFKDYGDHDKPLTGEEKDLIMRDLNIIYNNFIKEISINRNLDIEKVKQLADGSSMPGEMAIKAGLIDRIGGMYEVKEYLREKIGEDVWVCW